MVIIMDKLLISIFVPVIDRTYSIEIPINIETNTMVNLVQKMIVELSGGAYKMNENAKLYDKATGLLINQNNLVKFSGLGNGSYLMLM